jgi:hypothetical protein
MVVKKEAAMAEKDKKFEKRMQKYEDQHRKRLLRYKTAGIN